MAKILIAEDDRISQKLAAKIVEELGHSAFISPHGKHAYEALTASNDFDLLLTDIMMPEMDGQQLIQTLRGDQPILRFPNHHHVRRSRHERHFQSTQTWSHPLPCQAVGP